MVTPVAWKGTARVVEMQKDGEWTRLVLGLHNGWQVEIPVRSSVDFAGAAELREAGNVLSVRFAWCGQDVACSAFQRGVGGGAWRPIRLAQALALWEGGVHGVATFTPDGLPHPVSA